VIAFPASWAAFAAQVEASAIGVWMRESANAYPAANLVHLLGLVMLLGAIGIADLRIAGAFRTLPLRPVVTALTPIGLVGLALLALSGPLLFAADATALVRSDVFARKLVLIGFALFNALLFRWQWRRGGDEPTGWMRAGAIASLLLWIMVAALGRLIAYR
jgi:hypothetical protein